ncbi:BTAD domain-containing putative transcriptional regulator [Streptomyces lancefieldiae]|uniref:BTAD domain-containing putative transcriptional regulator n=1 Tax=Streptomyces lancefieldiae TaxID=3075520 RepID=A0ABU3B280_9ACTN|nr:BTAD domain-containing putative transcriptional regulator [Streptomyces sp. DSM 40712]MDT0615403.1 BTAD domain-containing putative transcriptional regulator [Streptomyces sp. DSM 40712]
MRFHVLGPLEVTDQGEAVPIQGIKQRAVLGFLLLSANRAVATSALMDALWPGGEAPNTARKILHNAIWGLRSALGSGQPEGDGPALITRPPGYVLQLDQDAVDLHRFQRLAEEGRSYLAEGSAQRAAAVLRKAVGLWRGAVLADLVEAGFAWPELAGLESTRVDVLEDYFDAELSLGRHHAVLRDIEAAAEAGLLRERLCGQRMLALYRCGRHTDALGAYNRMRRQLVEQLGLEPGRKLQWLQQAILRHDDSLLVPEAVRETIVAGERSARQPRTAEERSRTSAGAAEAGASRVLEHPETVRAPYLPTQRANVAPASAVASVSVPSVRAGVVRQDCSVVMVQAAVDERRADPEVTRAERSLAETLRRTAGYFDGTVAAPAGPALLAVFTGPDAAKRAVSTALAMLEPRVRGMSARAVVVTGEARLFQLDRGPEVAPMVAGPVLDTCRAVMAHTAPGTVRACERTREQTSGSAGVSYAAAGRPAAGWRARSVRWRSLAHPSIPIVDRDYELEVLYTLLGRARHRSVAQLVTVLGDAGVGKTRMVLEFERRAVARWDDVELVVSGPDGADRPLGLLRNLLLALCHAPVGTDPATSADLVRQVTHGCIADRTEAARVGDRVTELITAGEQGPPPHRQEALLAAGCRLLNAAALDHPLVVFVDDGHELDDAELDFLEQFVAGAPSPLMLIMAARPELLPRRPSWGSGRTQGATLTLPRPTDATVDRLSDILLARMKQGRLELPTPVMSEMLDSDAPHARRRALVRTLMCLDTTLTGRLVTRGTLPDLSTASSATGA